VEKVRFIMLEASIVLLVDEYLMNHDHDESDPHQQEEANNERNGA
jgi:hypothetical protein